MNNFVRQWVIRISVAIITFCVIALMLLEQGCGPLSPHINGDLAVTGRVDTSGTQTVTIDIATLSSFFKDICAGYFTTQVDIDKCATGYLASLLATLGSKIGGK